MSIITPVLPDGLRQTYFKLLKARRLEMAQFLARCEDKQTTPDDCKAAQRCAHNLSGSGKTYGYPDISLRARALEDALNGTFDSATLENLIRALLNACDDILRATDTVIIEPQIIQPANHSDERRGANKKPIMLIAEDDPAVSEMLQRLFVRDADVLMAANGKAAFDLIERHKPDLVILDDNMPEMTGAEVLEKLHKSQNAHATQIVMLTSNNRMTDIVRGISAGVIDYITKPFEPGRLANHIRRLLRHLDIKILVADDDMAVRELLLHKFRKLGFQVLMAEDGEQTLKLAHDENPQLLILDRMMPGLDGLAVLRSLREDHVLRNLPVILLTAKRLNKDVVEGFHMGATDYVVKPFMPDEVVARAMQRLGLTDTDA